MPEDAHRPPNILLLFPDQWRWDWLGCCGTVPVRTPNIDALAQRGVRLTQCRSNAPVSAPSRASMVTGLRPHRTGVLSNSYDLDPAIPNYHQLLRAAGYRVANSGKCDLHKLTKWYGMAGWTRRLGQYGFTEAIDYAGKMDAAQNGWPQPHGPYTAYLQRLGLMQTHYDDYKRRRETVGYPHSTWPSPLPREHYTDDFCGRGALELLERLPVGEPWHLWVNFPGPHDPFDPPEPLQRLYDGVDFPMPAGAFDPGLDHAQLRRNYAACIEGIDQWIGHILDAIDKRGEMAGTIVIFSSDHGEMLGDYGIFQKGVPQEGSVHVPLIVAGPGIGEGLVSEALVELVDLSAMMLDVAALAVPSDWDSRTLAPLLRGDVQTHRECQVSMLGPWRSICDGRYKLVEHREAGSSLYDLANAAPESHPVDGQGSGRAAQLHDMLVAEVGDKWLLPDSI